MATAYKPASAVSNQFRVGPYTLTLSGGTTVSVYDAAEAAGIPVGGVISLVVTVTGPYQTLAWCSLLSFPTTFQAGCTLTLINQSQVIGAGGQGGGCVSFVGGSPGFPGQTAIIAAGNTLNINNAAGYIFGGSGGGGGGGGADITRTWNIGVADGDPHQDSCIASGGGGGGGPGSSSPAGGLAQLTLFAQATLVNLPNTTQQLDGALGVINIGGSLPRSMTISQLSQNGTGITLDGITFEGGEAGVATIITSSQGMPLGSGGNGGRGGWGASGPTDFGQAGEDGQAGTASGGDVGGTTPAGLGGVAGKAVDLNGFLGVPFWSGGAVNWIAGNTSDRVKGAVS